MLSLTQSLDRLHWANFLLNLALFRIQLWGKIKLSLQGIINQLRPYLSRVHEIQRVYRFFNGPHQFDRAFAELINEIVLFPNAYPVLSCAYDFP